MAKGSVSKEGLGGILKNEIVHEFISPFDSVSYSRQTLFVYFCLQKVQSNPPTQVCGKRQ